MRSDVAIIGAGIAGLAAAKTLVDSGKSVAIIDKSRGVGGRMATRRIDDARLDHGAQFFTVRGSEFASLIDDAIAAEVVAVWTRGFSKEDGYPRYACPGGMTGLAKWLSGTLIDRGAELALARRIETIGHDGDDWLLGDDDGIVCTASHVVVTTPVPQALDLFANSHFVPDPVAASALAEINYHRVMALLVTLDGSPAIPPPGAIQADQEALFSFIADNMAKGVSNTGAVTFHVNHETSAQRWDDSNNDVITDLLNEAKPWIGDATVRSVELQKWRYAGPITPYSERSITVATQPGLIVIGGDAFGGPKVEGAFNSGLACGRAILSHTP